MFENIVVQPNFSHFFLQKLLGKFSSLSDLQSLDEELFRNLMFLKTFHGDARDLMLSFSITEDVLGVQSDVDLCPNGSELEVTSNNKLRYVYQMANYRLNTKIKKQCDAFLRGVIHSHFQDREIRLILVKTKPTKTGDPSVVLDTLLPSQFLERKYMKRKDRKHCVSSLPINFLTSRSI